mgnify:CR=1 FL=1
MKRPVASAPRRQAVMGLQCICCGHVEAPAENLFRCQACGGLDTRPFLADLLEGQEDTRSVDLRLDLSKEARGS